MEPLPTTAAPKLQGPLPRGGRRKYDQTLIEIIRLAEGTSYRAAQRLRGLWAEGVRFAGEQPERLRAPYSAVFAPLEKYQNISIPAVDYWTAADSPELTDTLADLRDHGPEAGMTVRDFTGEAKTRVQAASVTQRSARGDGEGLSALTHSLARGTVAGADWWQRVWSALQGDSDLPEEATKQRIIEPTLAYLGWDLYGTEVQREYPVDEGGRDEAVDYGLLDEGRPLVLVEAKRLKSLLGEKEARKVLGYARLEETRWCVLTNGRRWKLYNAEWSKNPDEALVGEWELTEGPGFPETVNILSKKAVLGGELDRVAEESMSNQKLLQALNKVLPELEEDLLRGARNRVYGLVHERFAGLTRSSVENFVRKRLQVSLRGGEVPEKIQPVIEKGPVGTEREEDRALGLWPLPGGIHRYVESAVAMLEYVAAKPPRMDDMVRWIKTKFERAKSDKTIPSYINVLRTLGLIVVDGGRIELTLAGQQCLTENPRHVLTTQLRKRVAGVEEILSALESGPLTVGDVHMILLKELGVTWETPNQTKFRLLWMQNVGLIAQDDGRYRLGPT